MNSQLPRSSWIQVALGDLGTLHCGQSPATSDVNREGNGELYVTGPEQWHDSKVRKTKWTTTPKRIAPDGSIFIAVKGAGVGKIAFGIRCAIGRDVYAFEASKHLDQRFIFWAIKEGVNDIVMKAQGDIPGISKGHILDHVIRLPSLPTQRKTVEKIEAVFERIDKGVENLRAAKTTLALYRQSLLKSAFEGRLTADWRAQNAEKLEDPKTLLARIRQERDARYKAALDDWQTALVEWRDGGEKGKKPAKPKRSPNFKFQVLDSSSPWPMVRVEAILRAPLINGRSVKDKADGFPVLRLTALKNGKIVLSEHKQGNWTEDDARPFLIERDDIFLARGNGSKKLVGIAGRVMETPKPVAFPDTMIRVRLDTSAISPEFFLFAWNSWTVRSQIEKAARTTAGIYKINQDHVSGFILPIPSIAEQAEITRILDTRLDAADKMEAEIDATLIRADALRQSILKQAFSGKLVPQDPTDEPAPTLLARIKAEQAQAGKTKKRSTAHA